MGIATPFGCATAAMSGNRSGKQSGRRALWLGMDHMTDTRIAIVTGANRGMGFETSRQLGKLGFKVVMGCRDPLAGASAAKLLVAEGLDVEPFRLDLTRSEDIATLAAYGRRHLRRVDVLINNGGIYLEGAGSSGDKRISAFEARLENVWATLNTNLIGPFALSREIIDQMRAQGHGRVVNLTSALGQLSDMGGGAPGYRFAAVGINAMTKMFAEELRGTDVLVNSVDPGWVQTHSPEATRTVEQGVSTTIWLATSPVGGPTGQFFRDKEPVPW
jgi:NAD(P)-dependent dehydrogenase (short-subunit alcohol dehydrogenase family)